MKIVLIDKEEGLKIGGVVVYSERLLKHLKSHGHKVYILRFTRKKRVQKNIFPIPYYFAESRSFIVVPSEKTQGIIRNLLVRLKPDIVYTSIGLSPLDFLLPSLCHELNIPIAGVWHADFNHSLSSFQILAKSLFLAYLPFTKQLDLIHVFSQKLSDFHSSKGISPKRILVLPNGVDEKFYTPGSSEFAKRYNTHKNILFLGRLTLQKNPEVLIKSFLSLGELNGTKLVLVGHGELEEELREKYPEKSIIFTGVVKDEKIKKDIMRACQLSVLPSRAEGMPLALLEAMSCGLACIASDAGSNSELLDQAGIIIPSTRLKQELPVMLRICLEYPEITQILGKKARQKVVDQYSQEAIFDKLTSTFKKTISEYKKRGSPRSKPIDIGANIGKRLAIILKRLESVMSID